jgi:enoyl-CoA hydratase
MNYENILIAQENGIATITINRPLNNKLNKKRPSKLHKTRTGKELRNPVVILTGSSEKAVAD